MTNIHDRQNMPGLKRLRSRYLRRAKTVARSEDFHEDVKAWRLHWNAKGLYQIVPVPAFDDLSSSPHIALQQIGFAPSRLIDDWSVGRLRDPGAVDNWFIMVEGVAIKHFPPRYYSPYPSIDAKRRPMDIYSHPAMRFVSACFFCDPAIVARHVEGLFDALKMTVMSLAFQPDSFTPYRVASLEAQARSLQESIRTMLTPDAADAALQASSEAARKAMDRTRMRLAKQDPLDRWWHIPLQPGISTADIQGVAAEAIEALGTVYGHQPLAHLIARLHERGLNRKEIADLLGADRDTVSTAIIASERAAGRDVDPHAG